MKLIFMGTGTSQGVPVIGYDKNSIDLSNPKNWRNRASVHIKAGGKHIQIDACPEFRIQCLQNEIDHIDAFILTHGHADHIAGMDDLRRFCDKIEGNPLDVYSNDYGIERIKAMFPYALRGKAVERGYPCFNAQKMPSSLDIGNGVTIKSVSLPHGPVSTLGIAVLHEGKKIVYYTDCKTLPEDAQELAKDADLLVLDALRVKPHPSHLNIEEAIEWSKKLNAKQTYLTHLATPIDYNEWELKLPKRCHLAYDSLSIKV